MRRSRFAAALALGVAAIVLLATPVLGQRRERDRDRGRRGGEVGDFIVLTGRLDIRRGQTVGDAVIFNGPARVAGRVLGTLVVVNGDLELGGSVEEDVVVIRGDVLVTEGARIGGDLITRRSPEIEEGATIEGDIQGFRPGGRLMPFLGRLAIWLAYSFSTLVLGLLLLLIGRRAADVVAATWRTTLGPAIGWGFAALLGLPLLAVLAFLTILGIPLGIAVLLGLLLIYSIGYVTGAWIVGRAILGEPRSRWLAFLLGWAILRVLALVPVLGGVLWLAAVVLGLGTLVVTVWRSRRVAPPPPAAAAPPEPAPA